MLPFGLFCVLEALCEYMQEWQDLVSYTWDILIVVCWSMQCPCQLEKDENTFQQKVSEVLYPARLEPRR